MAWRIAVGLVVAFLAGSAHARDRRVDRKAYQAGLAAWRGCFPEGSRVPVWPSIPDADDHTAGLDVRRTATGFTVGASGGGVGVEGGSGGETIALETRGCRALWVEHSTYDGALAMRVRIGWANRDAPTDSELRKLVAEPARRDDPAHAFARAWLTHRCRGGPDSTLEWAKSIEGPIAPAQPWHPGPPQRPPATLWTAAALEAIGAGELLRVAAGDEDLQSRGGPEIPGITVPACSRPMRTFAGAGVELFESEIPGRNGGRAIALRDPAANRHRWVVVTRGCVQGTTAEWLGSVGPRIVGLTRSRHGRYAQGDAILIIDVPTGTAWAVRLPEAIRDEAAVGAKIRAFLSSPTLALRAGKTSATIDLAPLVTEISGGAPAPRR